MNQSLITSGANPCFEKLIRINRYEIFDFNFVLLKYEFNAIPRFVAGSGKF